MKMSTLDIKEFAEKNKLSREDIAKILDSSIHSVNSWFSGSRNLPKVKERILRSYKVPIQGIEKNDNTQPLKSSYLEDIINDKNKIIELLERNDSMYKEIKQIKKTLEEVDKAVSLNGMLLDDIKEFWNDYLLQKSKS